MSSLQYEPGPGRDVGMKPGKFGPGEETDENVEPFVDVGNKAQYGDLIWESWRLKLLANRQLDCLFNRLIGL